PLPLVHGGELDAAARGHTRVVDDEVDTTPYVVDPRIRRRPVVAFAYVEATVRHARRIVERCRAFRGHVGREHPRTPTYELAGQRPAEPGRGSGHQHSVACSDRHTGEPTRMR